MVTYLREMAAVSESIAGGDLSVEVKPRSSRDTLGNAFREMVEACADLVSSVRDSVVAGGQRLQPGGGRFRRIRQDQRAGGLCHR